MKASGTCSICDLKRDISAAYLTMTRVPVTLCGYQEAPTGPAMLLVNRPDHSTVRYDPDKHMLVCAYCGAPLTTIGEEARGICTGCHEAWR